MDYSSTLPEMFSIDIRSRLIGPGLLESQGGQKSALFP